MRIDVTLAGRDVTLVAARDATAADLAAAVPGTPGSLGHPDLAVGMRLDAPRAPRPSGHRLQVVCGPGAGGSVKLGAEPAVVGRAPGCELTLPDPRLSRRHLAVTLGPRGAMVRDLGSSHGTAVAGRPVGPEWQPVAAGELVRAADTFLTIEAGAPRPVPVRSGPDGTGLVAPAPARPAGATAAPEIALPAAPVLPERSPVQWLAVLAPAVAGVVLAAVLGAWTFLLLAVLSPLAILAGGLVERWRGRRGARRLRADHARALAAAHARVAAGLRAEARQRRARDPDPVRIAAIAAAPGARLWERRAGAARSLRVRLGLGDADSQLRVVAAGSGGAQPAGVVSAVPRCLDLAAAALALTGPVAMTRAVGRWLVAQLAVLVPPTGLEVVLLADADGGQAWHWLRWLPHWERRTAIGAAACRELIAELAAERSAREATGGAGRWTLLVVDGCPETGALAALLDGGTASGLTGIWVDRGTCLPPCPARAAATDEAGTRLRVATVDGPIVADQVDGAWAEQVARSLAPLRPEGGATTGLPATARLLDLVEQHEPWQPPDAGLPFVLGSGPDGPLVVDLVRDGPHALVAGTTGAGKSELLRTLVTSLARAHPPDRLAFVLVDYKGGAAFAECARLPHTAGCVTDLDAHLTARALRSLERELRRRERLLADAGAADLAGYHAAGDAAPIPRLVIVVDEFAALSEELPEFVTGLVGISARGRSLGIHLVLATQRPSGVVSPEIRANTGLRIALRVTDVADSRDVIDADDAALLERRYPGRAVLRVAGGDLIRFQTATVSLPAPPAHAGVAVVELGDWRRPPPEQPGGAGTDLAAIVTGLCARAEAEHRPRPGSPWLPPLPDAVSASGLDGVASGVVIGLADLPDEQSQRPLPVDIAAGCSLIVAGGPRSGRSGALLTLALQAARRHSPQELQICAIDLGGALAPLAGLPHTGSIVTDVAGAAALLRRAEAERDLLLLVDGYPELLAASEQADHGETADALLALLRTAPSRGATVAVAGDRAVLAPRVAASATLRLTLRLPDPADYALAGLAPRLIPARMPPGRAVRCPDGVEVQLAAPPADPAAEVVRIAARWPGRVPGRIVVRPLPDRIDWRELPRFPGRLVLGAGGDTADALAFDPFAGAGRLLVCGPPGSGRTTALASLREQATALGWAVHDPVVADAGADAGGAADATGPLLVFADDAERLLDTGADAALLAVLARRERAGVATALIAATSSEQAAICYRGVIAEARRAGCLLLLHPGPAEAALVNLKLPRPPGTAPPGRGIVIGSRHWGPPFGAGPVPVQVAAPGGGLSPLDACAGSGDRWAARASP